MTDQPDAGDIDVRLEWPGLDPDARTRPVSAPPVAAPPAATAGDGRVRLKAGEGRSVAALRAEVDALRAEVVDLRAELAAVRDGTGPGA